MEAAPLFEDVAEAPKGGQAFFVRAADGTRIRFALWAGEGRGLAFIFPGRTECIEKYGRMAGRLLERGYGVVVIDWRGQGLSDRPNNSTSVGHVADFSDYQQDIAAVLAHETIAAHSGPRIIFAHSMGGCIGLRALLERQEFDKAVFSAPMWGLHLPGANRFIAPVLANIGTRIGLAAKPLIGQPKGFYLTRDPFKNNNLTHDRDHWEYMKSQIVKYPSLALGAPSFRWLQSALAEFKHFDQQTMPALPMLAFVGSEESIVSPAAIERQTKRFAQGKLIKIDGARHEIWMETPERQRQCWAAIDAFL